MHVIKDLVHESYHVWIKPSGNLNDCTSKIINVDINSIMFSEYLKQEILPKNLDKVIGSLLTIPEVSAEELNTATNNWNIDNVIGQGAFGVVYRGNLSGKWTITGEVAIKRIDKGNRRDANIKDHWVQSLNELRYLNKYEHDNILPIYGYKIEGDIFYLVVKLMSGSLKDRLDESKTNPLSWPSRLKIATGVAK